MRIGIVPPFGETTAFSVENYFQLKGLRSLLAGNELVRLSHDSNELCDLILFVGDRFLEDGYWDPWIFSKARKVVLGLSLGENRVWTDRTTEKMRAIGRSGGMGVTDEISLKKAKEILPASHLIVSGSPALFTIGQAFTLTRPVRVFCPAISDPAFSNRSVYFRLIRKFYSRMGAKDTVLFMCHGPDEFALGAVPGATTLYEPFHPGIHLTSLASASSVTGFRASALLAATASGVPALLIGNVRRERNAVEAAGVPFLEINPNTNAAELEHRVEEVFRKYPWETVTKKSAVLRNALESQLAGLGVLSKEGKKRAFAVVKKDSAPLDIGTVVSAKDVPAFMGFLENISAAANRAVHCHVLVLDRSTEALLQSIYSGRDVYFYRPAEIWEHSDVTPLVGSSASQCFVLKPRFLRMLLQKARGPILFADPSVHFLSDPADLLKELDGGHSLLFPRWSDALPSDDRTLFDSNLMLFEVGSEALLDWWCDVACTVAKASRRMSEMLTPHFLDQVPILFPGVRVYRAADQSVGEDSPKILGAHFSTWPEDPLLLADDRRVHSFHFGPPGVDVRFGLKTVWNQAAYLFGGAPEYSAKSPFLAQLTRSQASHWKALGDYLALYQLGRQHFPWFVPERARFSFYWCVRGPLRHGVAAARNLLEALGLTAEGTGEADGSAALLAWQKALRAQVFAPYQNNPSESLATRVASLR
jgi:hypothetical protein